MACYCPCAASPAGFQVLAVISDGKAKVDLAWALGADMGAKSFRTEALKARDGVAVLRREVLEASPWGLCWHSLSDRE